MTAETLDDIVNSAQRNNAAKGVTGLLCHYDGSIMQFLEGDEASVSPILAAISRDARHRNLLEVYREPISERLFGAWTMAIVKPGDLGPAQQAFSKSLLHIELAGDARHRNAVLPFLEAFRAWIR